MFDEDNITPISNRVAPMKYTELYTVTLTRTGRGGVTWLLKPDQCLL